MKDHYSIIIIGGRIAGSVLASKLGDAGIDILIIDKTSFPSNTLSSHFFRGMSAIRIFDEIGILNQLLETNVPKLTHQVDYIDGTSEYELKEAQGASEIGFNLNLRRYTLDDILNQRVRKTPNVDFYENTKLVNIEIMQDQVILELQQGNTTYTVSTELLVGADGRNSTVAKYVSPEEEFVMEAQRVMFYQYYSEMETFDGKLPFASEYSINQDEVAYIFPTDENLFLVAISLNRRDVKTKYQLNGEIEKLFENHSPIFKRINKATPVSKIYRSDYKENYVRKPYGKNWVLVGDAGIHLDPWSGLGIDLATVQSNLLAKELIHWKRGIITKDEALQNFHITRNEKTLKLYHKTVNTSKDMRVLNNQLIKH